MESITALIESLRPLAAAGVRLDAEAIAEALWLSRIITERPPGSAAEEAGDSVPPPPLTGERRPPEHAGTGTAAVTAYGAPDAGAGPRDAAVMTVGVPRVPAVARKPAVLSELRPLARRTPAPGTEVFDEDLTVERTAATQVPWPVTRPELLRERDLCLVLDRDPTMAAWEGLAREVRALFEALGAFRRVEVWYAESDPFGDLRLAKDALGLAGRPLSSLRDPSGRRIVVVLTTALGDAWLRGSAAAELDKLAECAPVAVAQPLPAELWPRTGLDWAYGRIAPKTPGAPSALKLAGAGGAVGAVGAVGAAGGFGRAPRLAPVPVFELRRGWLGPWARTLTGDGSSARYPLLRLAAAPGRDSGHPPASDPAYASPLARQQVELGVHAEEQVERFRSASSADAYRLAVLLSVASLTPPVMRLIQRVMMPESDQSVLAEVIAGGLLETVPAEPGVHRLSEDHRAFSFRPQVADVLRRGLRRSETSEVHAATSAFLEDWLGVPVPVFQATLSLPAGAGERHSGLPFAYMRPALLERVATAFPVTPASLDYGELARFRDADPTETGVANLHALLILGRRLLGAMPRGDEQREGVLGTMIDLMSRLWTETGDPEVLDEAIALGKASLADLDRPRPRAERMVRVAALLAQRFALTADLDLLVECARLLRAAIALDLSEAGSDERSLRYELLGDALSALGARTREPADLLEAAAYYRSAEQRAAGGRRPLLALKSVSAGLGVVELTGELSELTLNRLVGDFRRAHAEREPEEAGSEPRSESEGGSEPGSEPDSEFASLRAAVLRQAEALSVPAAPRERLVDGLRRQVRLAEGDFPYAPPPETDVATPLFGDESGLDDDQDADTAETDHVESDAFRAELPARIERMQSETRPDFPGGGGFSYGNGVLSGDDFLYGDESAGSGA